MSAPRLIASDAAGSAARAAAARKFVDPDRTAGGEPRAWVALRALDTLWFNTGTLCNLTCRNCYIESSPSNDALVFLTVRDIAPYLDEIRDRALGTRTIGLTGGEPFMNPDILAILRLVLARGFEVLVLTNAMRPMQKHRPALRELNEAFPGRLTLRVSVDHFRRELHQQERGRHAWTPMLRGLEWLAANGFHVDVAGRTRWGDSEADLRAGFAALFAEHGVAVDATDPHALTLFPEMDPDADVPEITTACWDLLGKSPEDVMCASARMVVKRHGSARPVVVACTLLPHSAEFELGDTLAQAMGPVKLNHVHCAAFCVLGGGACS